ncbi:MAG: hypothetical protein ACE5KM_18320, partial [Planctomycetaceae bacterium]
MTLTKRRAVVWSLFGLLATVLAAGPLHAQEKLRWKLKKGQTLNYVMTQKMNMTTMAGGMALNIKMTNTMDMRWKIETVKSDGTA